jgi:hypothetical protein
MARLTEPLFERVVLNGAKSRLAPSERKKTGTGTAKKDSRSKISGCEIISGP